MSLLTRSSAAAAAANNNNNSSNNNNNTLIATGFLWSIWTIWLGNDRQGHFWTGWLAISDFVNTRHTGSSSQPIIMCVTTMTACFWTRSEIIATKLRESDKR